MRRAWWIGLVGVMVWCLAACEVDEGNDADGGDAAGDTGGDAALTPLCADNQAYQDSCLAEFFTACFAPAGTCSVVERTAVGFDEVSAIVWQNGTEWEERYDTVDSSLDVIVRSDATAQCAAALGSTEGTDGEWNLNFTPESGGTDQLSIVTDASGNMVVHCAGGGQETYTATEADAALSCLGAVCNGQTLRDRR